LGLYCLSTQIAGSLIAIPSVPFNGFGLLWPMREITLWVGAHVLKLDAPLSYTGNSRDTDFYWVQMLWVLIVSILGTLIWWAADHKRLYEATLHKWFRVFVRFALASQMFEYGMTKIIPVQFPTPSLITLLTPVGNLSSQGILWTSVGAAPAYELFTGVAELLGGILLLFPKTTLLGAMVCLADMTYVFVLNVAYDVGVKQVSFHLILLCCFLIAADLPRIIDFFFRNRPVNPSSQTQLFLSPRANRIALAIQVAIGIYLVAIQADANWVYWYEEGGGKPKSPLYGIWDVEQLAVDGKIQPVVLNDYDLRWRRVIFDAVDSMAFQRPDDSFGHFGASIDTRHDQIALTKGNSRHWKSNLRFQQPTQDQLILDGEMDVHKIHAELRLVEFDTLRLLNSKFRWIRPPDPPNLP
jgi:hypothetical protein